MYISGAPGTGKTSCLMHVMSSLEKKISHAFLNCMSVSNPENIYKNISMKLRLSSKITNSKNIKKALEKYILSSPIMTVLILDEIDQLDCKGQQILYSLFEWPQMPKSTLILIGIANALDMTDRMLPRLHAFKYEPVLLHFQPYTKDQIVAILEDRLSSLQCNGISIIKPLAIQFCARKIAASTGDIRKALDVCRRAIEMVETNAKRQLTLKATFDDRCNPGSPMKRIPGQWQSIDLSEISSILHEVYGSRLQTFDSSKRVAMPLQHMILLCTLVLMKKHCKIQDTNLGKVYDVYRRVCKKREITEVPECTFHGICKLVESRGFIELKTAKVARMSKIILKIDETEAEHVMQDKAMLRSILADKSVLSNSLKLVF
ncbi:Cell division control protein 6-like protein, partial [Stegodyphus mimosarum]